jgi:uncharacterized protein YuzE
VRLSYYPETDSLYIELSDRPGSESREVSDGVVVDLDADGNAVGIDIQHASESLDLETLETSALPLTATRSA